MYRSVTEFPNTAEGLAEWRRQADAEMKRMLARLQRALPKLQSAALGCPFCGKRPTIGPTRPDLEGDAWGFVKCENGHCPVQPECRDGSSVSDERGSAAYIALAIRRWNRRA